MHHRPTFDSCSVWCVACLHVCLLSYLREYYFPVPPSTGFVCWNWSLVASSTIFHRFSAVFPFLSLHSTIVLFCWGEKIPQIDFQLADCNGMFTIIFPPFLFAQFPLPTIFFPGWDRSNSQFFTDLLHPRRCGWELCQVIMNNSVVPHNRARPQMSFFAKLHGPFFFAVAVDFPANKPPQPSRGDLFNWPTTIQWFN